MKARSTISAIVSWAKKLRVDQFLALKATSGFGESLSNQSLNLPAGLIF
jgi:hypothetical protein